MAYLVLGVVAVAGRDTPTVSAAWLAMALIGWYAIVPLALAALLSGILISLGTPWGLFRHYWVAISLALTVFATVVLLLHMPSVSAAAALARAGEVGLLAALTGDLPHPSIGLLVLLAVAALNVYKPRGVTPFGWRRQRAERRRGGTKSFRQVE